MILEHTTKAALAVATGVTLIAAAFYFSGTPSTSAYKGVVVTVHQANGQWSADFTWQGTAISMYADSAETALRNAQRTIDVYVSR